MTRTKRGDDAAVSSVVSESADSIIGILILDKPLGMTSMQAVAIVRRRATPPGVKKRIKTGHAGTLDPLASGVLVIAVGKATKSLDMFMRTDKRYRTTIDLSAFTTTDDREGERTEVEVPEPPSREMIDSILPRFTGRVMQRPPTFSAMKVGGRRAYKMARAGQPVEVEPRPVIIHHLAVVEYDWPLLEVDVHCGKGTYIRSLARDLGEALGTGGHCAELRRTAVGPFDETMAIALDDLPQTITQNDLMPLDRARAMVDANRMAAG